MTTPPTLQQQAEALADAIFPKLLQKDGHNRSRAIGLILQHLAPLEAQLTASESDSPENITDNPKSWIAWKRKAEELEAQLVTSREMLEGFTACYKRLMEAAPWSESNDMDIEDEMMCGLDGLIQERDEARREAGEWKQICKNRDATVKQQGDEWVKLKMQIDQLTSDNQQLRARVVELEKALRFVQTNAVFPLAAIPQRPWEIISAALASTPSDSLQRQQELERLAEIGKRWEADSSLEKWFPNTAEKIQELEKALSDLIKEASELVYKYDMDNKPDDYPGIFMAQAAMKGQQ